MSESSADKAIPVLVVGEKQLGESKIGRSPVQFESAPVLRAHPGVKWTI